MKLSYQDKIEIYEKYEWGMGLTELSLIYDVNLANIKYLLRLIKRHGYEMIRKSKNNSQSKAFKEELIDKVLFENKSLKSVAIEAGLTSAGMLCHWISNYKKNGDTVIDKPKGRKSMNKQSKNKSEKNLTREQPLEQENLYLRAELEYLKK